MCFCYFPSCLPHTRTKESIPAGAVSPPFSCFPHLSLPPCLPLTKEISAEAKPGSSPPCVPGAVLSGENKFPVRASRRLEDLTGKVMDDPADWEKCRGREGAPGRASQSGGASAGVGDPTLLSADPCLCERLRRRPRARTMYVNICVARFKSRVCVSR